jgi:hypothetical protein
VVEFTSTPPVHGGSLPGQGLRLVDQLKDGVVWPAAWRPASHVVRLLLWELQVH